MNETIRNKMLGDLIDKLQDKNRPHGDLDCLVVDFFDEDNDTIVTGIPADKALDYLFNNTCYFEDFSLVNAVKLELHSI